MLKVQRYNNNNSVTFRFIDVDGGGGVKKMENHVRSKSIMLHAHNTLIYHSNAHLLVIITMSLVSSRRVHHTKPKKNHGS